MPELSFKMRLKKLSSTKKLILIGSGLSVLSVFLPWYSDIDRFNTGDTFFGISGPLYLAGLIIMFSCAISFGIIMLRLLEKPLPKLPIEEDYIHIFAGSFSLLMLVLINSVYFHPKFGINITDKSVGIGMIAVIIGIAFLIIGGFWNLKRKDVNFEQEGKIEPLIDLSQQDRTQSTLKTPETHARPLQETLDDLTKNPEERNFHDIIK